jgi:hypothetical protein
MKTVMEADEVECLSMICNATWTSRLALQVTVSIHVSGLVLPPFSIPERKLTSLSTARAEYPFLVPE